MNGVDAAAAGVDRFAKGLLAGAEAREPGVAELVVPKRLVEDDEDAVPSGFCAAAPKLNKLDAGAVAVAFGVL